jgi:hypothetical protein
VNVKFLLNCYQCPHRPPMPTGPCICSVNGRDIMENAAAGICPIGRTRAGLGDLVAAAIHRLRLKEFVSRWRIAELRCGVCENRQKQLNTAPPWSAVWNWTLEARQAWIELAGVVMVIGRRLRRPRSSRAS